MKRVAIVGAGIGGLSTAIRLLKNGYKVTIIEKESTVGGKINQLNQYGNVFDLTASIIMTPQIYIDLFKYINKDYTKYIELIKLDTMYNVFYNDGKCYEFYSDIGKTIKMLEDIDKNISKNYLDYITDTYKKYININDNFLKEPMIELYEMINLNSLKNFIKLKPMSNSYKYISKYIKNDKIRDFIIFQSMYIGTNPYKSSNLYTVIPVISQIYGLWYIKGGMYSYIKALEKIIYEMGGEIHTNLTVENIIIDNGIAKGLRTKNKDYLADIVVCNADFPYAIKNLIKEDTYKDSYTDKKINEIDYSCSTFIMYLNLKKKYKRLKVHNLYIGDEFRKNIESAFNGKITDNPSFYMYCPSKVDKSICNNFKENLNIMLRVPNLSYEDIVWDEKLVKKVRDSIIKNIAKIKGMEDIEENIAFEEYLTPVDLKEKFNSYNGCAFGIDHNLNQLGYFRPNIKSKSVKNLYFIGSSTHPGNGVSVIIDGSKLVANEIIKNS